MKRVLAVVGAALLIAAAVLVRGVLDDDGGGDEVATGDGDDDPADLVVACVTELRDVCETLDGAELRIEDPAETIADPDVDAWVTFDPWPEIAGETITGPLTEPGTAVAETPAALVLHSAAVEACPDRTWRCVVDTYAERVATRPADTALGLLTYGSAASDWFGVATYAANDFAEPGFRTWITSIGTSSDPVEEMLQFRGAQFVAAGTTGVDADRRLNTAADADSYTIVPGAVPGTVVAVVSGPEAEQVGSALRGALLDAGWEPADAGARSLGIPNAGVLFALAQEVS